MWPYVRNPIIKSYKKKKKKEQVTLKEGESEYSDIIEVKQQQIEDREMS